MTTASAGRMASGPFLPQAPQRGYRSVLVVGIGCHQMDLEIETGISILHQVGSPSYCVIRELLMVLKMKKTKTALKFRNGPRWEKTCLPNI